MGLAVAAAGRCHPPVVADKVTARTQPGRQRTTREQANLGPRRAPDQQILGQLP